MLAVLSSHAQEIVSGQVVDRVDGQPLVGASVMLRDADGKIKKYSLTKDEGLFEISVPSIKGCRLEVSMMSFTKQSLSLDSTALPLTVYMEPGGLRLKEVAIKADRIREQGDTITYSVGSFARTQDRSIGDVLRRMPGIEVSGNGKIQYQGTDINKFYIEGSDLLGGRYGLATNGINHEDVGAVEVMENHQPMQVLSGLSFSDKAAINLKLKNKAKATWGLHGDAAAGWSQQPEGVVFDAGMFALAVWPSFQNLTTLKANNNGTDLSAQATDFFSSRRSTGLGSYLSVSLPDVPGLNRRRTLFNRSALFSTNSLWKSGRGEFKAQIDYAFNRIEASAANMTTYFLSDGNRVVTENRTGVDHKHSLAAKFIYELNGSSDFINNTLKTNLDWDDLSLDVSGSFSNMQTVRNPDYFVSNDFKLIHRFRKHHLITLRSQIEWESLPQTLKVMDSDRRPASGQQISDHAFFTRESASYAFTVSGFTVSLEGGVEVRLRSLRSDCFGFSDLTDDSGIFTNLISTDSYQLFLTPKLEYWIKRVNISLSAPLSLSRFDFSKSIADHTEFIFAPSLNLNWKPSSRLSMSLNGGVGRSPINLNLIHPGFIASDYRSLNRGVEDFYISSSQNISASVAYKHTRHGLFANAFASQSWSSTPYTRVQQLFGDYAIYSYSPAENRGSMLLASGNIGKTLEFMRSTLNLGGSFSSSKSHLISEGQDIATRMKSWSLGMKLSASAARWLNLDYRMDYSASQLNMNGSDASWLGNLENEFLVNIVPADKWEWHISADHYRNSLGAGEYKNIMLFDTKLIFKPSKRVELSASLSNIFNQRTYSYKSYSQLTSFESCRWLRGREFMISIILKK